jgi:hypothetical protein
MKEPPERLRKVREDMKSSEDFPMTVLLKLMNM